MTLLDIQDLTVRLNSAGADIALVQEVSLAVEGGQTLCIVGESGSGKTVTAMSVIRLLEFAAPVQMQGAIVLRGIDLVGLSANQMRGLRGSRIGMVFQEALDSLNPSLKIGRQLLEAHRPDGLTARQAARQARERALRLLTQVGLDAARVMTMYPHQLSGGMQQRVMIALALASEPQLLVADEPTTALDVTIQAQILDLLREVKQRLGMAILLITHNLGIVGDMADRVAVMYAGQIVELAPARELLRRPLHPYTRALMASVPKLQDAQERLTAIPGQVPQIGQFPPGCRFAPRCPIARPECSTQPPELVEVEPGRWVRCPFWK